MMNEITIIKSKRKSIAIEIKPDLQIIVRAPLSMSEREIKRFVREKSDWLEIHLEKMRRKIQERENIPKMTAEELHGLTMCAKDVIPKRVAHFAALMRVTYGRITIRHQRTRWGSCSSEGNLNFNCLLMKTPLDVIDYVVVHELCHRREMNHSPRFWEEVENVLPDYKTSKKWLKEHGGRLIEQL